MLCLLGAISAGFSGISGVRRPGRQEAIYYCLKYFIAGRILEITLSESVKHLLDEEDQHEIWHGLVGLGARTVGESRKNNGYQTNPRKDCGVEGRK